LYKYIKMSGPIFDANHDPLGDLTLKMTDDLEPEDNMETPDIKNIDDDIKPNVESVEKEIIKPQEDRPVADMFVTKKKKKKVSFEGVKEDEVKEDWSESITNDEKIPPKIRGERGKDKKPRKKRQMTPAALEKLKIAREKSLATRRAKAALKKKAKEDLRVATAQKKRMERQNVKLEVIPENVKIEKKAQQKPANVFNDFDKFCNFMDRYDERKKKKHSTSRQPHPNQKIPERQRPRPPVQPSNRNPQFRQTGGSRRPRSPPPTDFSPFSLLKSGRRSVFGNSGMNNSGGYNNNW